MYIHTTNIQGNNSLQEEAYQTQSTATEMNASETMKIKAIQACSFEIEIPQLKCQKTTDQVQNAPKYVTQFGLYLDEQGIVRDGGRIRCLTTKTPIYFPGNTISLHKNTEVHK